MPTFRRIFSTVASIFPPHEPSHGAYGNARGKATLTMTMLELLQGFFFTIQIFTGIVFLALAGVIVFTTRKLD